MKNTIIENDSEIKLQNDLNHHIGISSSNSVTTTTATNINNNNNNGQLIVEKTLKAINLIENSIKNHILKIDYENCLPNDEDSFFVCDLGEIINSVNQWKQQLPMIQPYYAVKCNSNFKVLTLLNELGINFDCASKNEIDLILSLNIQQAHQKIIYANPCKTNSFIRHAANENVNLTTVDNIYELYKLAKFHPHCKILIRLITDDSTAQCQLSSKFGCELNIAIKEILPKAKELGLQIYGVAFHVGSGAKDFNSIYQAIKNSRILFNEMLSLGFQPKLLDIGGGFERETFLQLSQMVKFALSKYFPQEFIQSNEIKFIAEPGRFMVANAFTLITHVIARRDLSTQTTAAAGAATVMGSNGNDIVPSAMLYINDGVYGNLNCILFDHQNPKVYVLTNQNQLFYKQEMMMKSLLIDTSANNNNNNNNKVDGFNFSIWGPTCDGLDCVSSLVKLSKNVQVGDWLFFENVGAYTSCASTKFNGLSNGETKTLYVNSNEE